MADSFEFRVKVRIGYIALFIAALVIGVTALTYFFSRSGEDLRKTITFGSSLFGAAVAISTLFYTAQNIRRTNDEKIREASLAFVQRWNAPGYWAVKSEWRKLNDELDALNPEQRDGVLRDDVQKRIVAVEILNFYEEMATGINNGSLDGSLLRQYWETVIVESFDRYECWIRQHRIRRSAPGYFDELENLVKEWKRPTT